MKIDPDIQQTILFLVQIFSLIFLIVYVIKTWEMASATTKAAQATEKSVTEMRQTRDQESAPYIIVYFDIPYESNLIYLVIKNIGRTIATNISLTFTPTLRSSNENVAAAQRLAREVAQGRLRPDDITEELFGSQLSTADLPDPDLLIRTSGEQRLSNFLLWQSAYTELVFVPTLWPDFSRDHLLQAIGEFQRRERRYGGTSG